MYELATRPLPLHRQLWEASPYAMSLCSAALVGWGAWRVAGRWGGMIAAMILICVGPGALTLLLVLNDHAPTWFTLALLGALLVLCEAGAGAGAEAGDGAEARAEAAPLWPRCWHCSPAAACSRALSSRSA